MQRFKEYIRQFYQHITEYIRQFRCFQRNARLFLLIYTLLGTSTGVSLVLYPLYLRALGYGTDFIGLQITIGILGAGLALVPAGLCVDRFGGKALLFWSGILLATSGGIHVLFRTPVLFSVGAFIGGIGGTVVLVLYSPFLTRNSTEAERPHLFSLNIVVYLVTTVLGEVLGAALPTFFQTHPSSIPPHLFWFLAPALVARSYQITLLLGILLSLPAFLPIFFIKNDRPTPIKPEQQRFRLPRKGSRSHPHDGQSGTQRDMTGLEYGLRVRRYLLSPLAVLMAVNLLVGLGGGMLVPYFGLFVVEKLGGTSALFGIIDGTAKVLTVLGTLLAPWLVMRIGRVGTIILPRLFGLLALLSMGFFPLLPLVVILYPLRQTLGNMGSGIMQLFSMEVFSPQRRGLSNSGYQGSNQLALAIAAPIGGLLIRDLGYTPVFVIMAACHLLALALFWWRFGGKRFVTTGEEPQKATLDGLGGDTRVSLEYAEQG